MNLKNYTNKKILSELNICTKIAVLLCFMGFQFSFAQNNCETALPITAGTHVVDMIDGSNVVSSCSIASMGEWYAYTPTGNYSVTVTSDLPDNICGDTNFSVYTGTCNAFSCYTSDDDSGSVACDQPPATGQTYLSKKTFDVVAGTTYYIVWDNKWSDEGFVFQVNEAPFIPSPCYAATSVTAGTTTVAAIDGSNLNTACSTTAMAKWYTYTPTQDFHLTITSDLPVNICKNTNFSVYTGSCSNGLSCITSDDNSGVIECNVVNNFSNLSKKTFDVSGGTTYYIAWDNKWSTDGFDFQIIEEEIVIPVTYTSQTIATINNGAYNICVVDMNSDLMDDIVSVSGSNLKVHYQQPDHTFTATSFTVAGTTVEPSWSLAAGDYNKDGYNDLVLGSNGGLSLWKSNEVGNAYTSITPGQYIFCQRTNFVDINNDGNLDVFSCHDIQRNVYYLNDGNAGMTYYQSGTTPGAYNLGLTLGGGNYASLWTDYDNDGDVDMFITKCSGPPCELHRNDGNAFTDVSALAGINVTPIQSWSSAIADFDNDGDMDILIGSNGSAGHKFFKNKVDTTNNVEEPFENVTSGSGWDTDNTDNRDYVAYDFDNNGFIDVFSTGGRIMFNQGDMTFSSTSYPALNMGPIGDLNNDGFLDVQNGNTIRYAVPNGNHWIKVGLKGTESNSNGIAARVEIYGAWGKQMRDIRSGEGFEFMSSLNAHFGIGSATEIDQLVITWPSGTIDVINNPTVDSMVTVNEGAFPLTVTEAESDAFVIYPNPANDIINIKSKSNAAIIKAEIFDLTGKLILKKESVNNTIPVSTLSSGTYIMKVLDVNGRQYTHKFVKS
jgi:ASPIC/UnbV protein/type IX secretion system substrate protein/VCBS repeat protein